MTLENKTSTQRVTKVLVANRGEIAVRVIRTCRRMGIRTVAVYSDADRDAPHVIEADEAVHVGPSPAKESYLVADRILAAAKATGANAVHPGYGFLSENDAFSMACADAGIVFVGPGPEAVRLMGNKRQAKLRMIAAGVPCIPGYEGEDQSDAVLATEAARIGYPVMVKAAAGGGGRGMRLVHEPSAFADAVLSARSEAQNAFGSSELILERAVVSARHVEIQVFADNHGNVVHLGERDCSVQRRHQKIVEESPSPAVGADLRRRMGEVAVAATRAIGYSGAGTLEFLLAPTGEFFFMEMNTRLQVEHPVTEAITGLDLVEWQLRVASGETLPLRQDDVHFSGHAIEVRLCAEEPARDFLPQTGRVVRFVLPTIEGVRVDHGVREGRETSAFYDSMQAKVIAHGATRDEARRKLREALHTLSLLGVVTNKTLLSAVLGHPAFVSGAYDTAFVPTHFDSATLAAVHTPDDARFALAAAVLFRLDADGLMASGGVSPSLLGWNSAHAYPSPVKLVWGDLTRVAQVRAHGADLLEVTVGAVTRTLSIVATGPGDLVVTEGTLRSRVRASREGDLVWVDVGDSVHAFADMTFRSKSANAAEGDGRLVAPIDGKVLRVLVAQGDAVQKGQLLIVLEAMKMEFQLVAPFDGTLASLSTSANSQVGARAVLGIVKKPDA